MKNSEIKQMTTADILDQIEEEKNILVRMKLNHAVSPLDNPNKIKFTRRNIARLKTELTRRETESSNEQQPAEV